MNLSVDERFKVSESLRGMSEQQEMAEEGYLRDTGWKETSSTPGCVWLWKKAVTWIRDDDKEVTEQFFCSRSTAVHIQTAVDRDDYWRAHPEIGTEDW